MPSALIEWRDDSTIAVEPPRRPKKMTATKFAAVLGLNRWSTPFQQWCEICRVHNEPFEPTIYTEAGRAIEPLQIAYMREAYAMDDLVDPTQVYGPDPFKATYGNFFDHPVFGGMWDAITEDAEGNVTSVLEFKTTKRAEDWAEDVPEYYALQAALYAWLLGCDDVIMVATFLRDPDYDHPEQVVVSAANTATFEFRVSERYPTFEEDYVGRALAWWREHVEGGVSPAYDERADADYLRALRTSHVSPATDAAGLLREYRRLDAEVAGADAQVAASRRRMQQIKGMLRELAEAGRGDAEEAVLSGEGVTCTLKVGSTAKVDEDALRRDGVWDKYMVTTESARFSVRVD